MMCLLGDNIKLDNRDEEWSLSNDNMEGSMESEEGVAQWESLWGRVIENQIVWQHEHI